MTQKDLELARKLVASGCGEMPHVERKWRPFASAALATASAVVAFVSGATGEKGEA